MDVFPGAATPEGLALNAQLGGSPFNVAVALARLGQPVSFLGGISTDAFGRRIAEALDAEGIQTTYAERVPQPTTLAMVDRDEAGHAHYTFYGANGADRQLTPRVVERLPASFGVMHVGSYATVVSPAAETLRALVNARRATTLISADPNVRLTVEPDPLVWRQCWEWLTTTAHVLKLSVEDLAVLCPGKTPLQASEAVLSRGVRLFVVTRGQAGAEAWTPWEHASVPVSPVHIVDTVGAGDTFQAGLLDWLLTRQACTPAALASLPRADLEGALRWAAKVAAVTCSRRGADPPRRSELV